MFNTTNRRAQIWVETAIYTLIGLTLISIVLSVAIPQVQKIKDRSVLQQVTDSLASLHKELSTVSEVAGNARTFYLTLEKGKLEINSSADRISYYLENTNYKFSEPEKPISYGELSYETRLYGSKYTIVVWHDYNRTINITFAGKEETRVMHNGIYKIKMENIGDGADRIHLDFDLV
ncbi:MAG: hypothetical protein AABX16_04065 [Nanoarchaeota archaeon]